MSNAFRGPTMIASATTLFTPAILIHTAAALTALVLGALMFLRPKGSGSHRKLGRTWAALMLVIIFSSFFIRTSGSFSWIHLLSVGSLIALVLAVHHARRRNVAAHRRIMIGLYAGGLITAGFFTLLPSRLLGEQLWRMMGWLG